MESGPSVGNSLEEHRSLYVDVRGLAGSRHFRGMVLGIRDERLEGVVCGSRGASFCFFGKMLRCLRIFGSSSVPREVVLNLGVCLCGGWKTESGGNVEKRRRSEFLLVH